METHSQPVTQRDFIRDKHREIYRKYTDLLRTESEENPLRAKHIGKLYYARVIADGMTPAMDANYVLRIINNQMRKSDR